MNPSDPARLRHDIGNLLAIAQANVEAMRDGVLETSPERLDRIAAAIRDAAQLLERL